MVKKIIFKIKCLEISGIKDLGAVEGSEASQCGTPTQSVAPTHVSLSTDTIMSNSSISVRQRSIIIQTAEAPQQLNSPRTTHIRKTPGVVGDASMRLGTWDNFTLLAEFPLAPKSKRGPFHARTTQHGCHRVSG